MHSRLNTNQKAAVLHFEDPLLILAGAGSGKTSVMSHRIAHLIAHRQIPPSRILGLSFTNKAANELKIRVKTLLKKNQTTAKINTNLLTICTFHSLCVRILRNHAEKLGFTNNFTILDSNDQTDILKQILRHIKIDDKKFDTFSILANFSRAKNLFLNEDQAQNHFLQTSRPTDSPSDYAIATATSFPRYLEKLKALNAMDFDDLLYYAVKLLRSDESVREEYNKKYKFILVDEYQDTNGAQFNLLSLLTERQQNICVVGDDDQSIYAWRGADPTHILEFHKHFPKSKKITLDQNYRSTTHILDAANAVISKNKNRHPKKLWSNQGTGSPITEIILNDDTDEAEWVADTIANFERSWKDIAVLYRSNAQSRVFEQALRARKISYQIVGGMSFLERKEIKDTLSYFRLILNPKDDAATRRVLNCPPRGIGKTSIEQIQKTAVSQSIAFFEACKNTTLSQKKSQTALIEFTKTIDTFRAKLFELPPSLEALTNWAFDVIQNLGLKNALFEENEDVIQSQNRVENMEELIHGIGRMKVESGSNLKASELLREYITNLTLEAQDQEENQIDENASKVTLLTLHGAKGLEYPVVFMVGMEDGFLPHQRSIEEARDLSEERRLCYVGITRAKEDLFLTRAQSRLRYGKTIPRNRSRFLDDIPKDLLIVQDQRNGPDLSTKEALEKHEKKVSSFLDQIKGNLSNRSEKRG